MEKKFVLMSKPALKCENNAIFKQIVTLKLFIAFKMAHSCYFSFVGDLDFREFLQKSFKTSTTEYNFPRNSQVSKIFLYLL